MTCSKCGRRASERMSYTRRTEKTPFGPGVFIDEVFCDGELHDAADRVEEMQAAIRIKDDKLASVKCQLLEMLDLIPVPGSAWRMNIKTMLRTIDSLIPPHAKETPE